MFPAMSEHDASQDPARSPQQEALQRALKEGGPSFGIGVAIAIVGMLVITALFQGGFALVLPLLFFVGVVIFTRRIMAEEREWRERVSR